MEAQPDRPARKRWNWWKIGFFVSLLAFEVAREIAVLANDRDASAGVLASVSSFSGFTAAEGRWVRIDGGDKLIPAAVRIECWQERGECTEASATANEGYFHAPTMETFKARFLPQAIEYENDNPVCAHYSVRIDLRLQKTFAVRERTSDKSPMCKGMERRMEMQLGDGFDATDNPLEGHFVPVLNIVIAIAKLF
jgi:hypothetical protein